MRLNQLTGRWVTIVADRAGRPTDFAPRGRQIEADANRPCPFCPGNEEATPPALEAVDEAGSWSIRIVPNLYPAFDGDDGFAVRHLGPVHVAAKASGIHEIFVFSPDHDGGLPDLDDRQASDLMHALQRRFVEHASTRHVRYTQAIVNHGHEAGASLSHPHGQLLGLPFVPGEVLDEERAFARFVGGCVLCTTVEAETSSGERIIFANDDVVVMCPYWSGSPYELLFVPRRHEQHLQDADDDSLDAMGRALRDATAFLNQALGDIAYNVGFHTAPHQHGGEFHWHIHLWPNLHTIAGFERGTGVLINVVPPEQAAEVLRGVAALA
ncbi:MAG TPA: galactose-1-phosphate uridylyltransferase [Ilumatobacteraceae bacterium]|nr:galactose-1-phosphate uridylyltransferase [Ilumatobacteraceae bacterium]